MFKQVNALLSTLFRVALRAKCTFTTHQKRPIKNANSYHTTISIVQEKIGINSFSVTISSNEMATNQKFTFRRAKIADISAVREMIQELADFEKMSDGPKLAEKDLIRDAGLDGGQEYCHIYVLELQTDEIPTSTTIGYCICFYSYSTWQGKAYFLEDIYVRPAYRGLGAGAYLFRAVAAKAKEFNCQRLDFHVLGWNPARKFYDRMGAIDLTESEEWHFYRVDSEQIEKLANEL